MWLLGENLPTDLHLLHWHSQTCWTVEMPMGALNVGMVHVHHFL